MRASALFSPIAAALALHRAPGMLLGRTAARAHTISTRLASTASGPAPPSLLATAARRALAEVSVVWTFLTHVALDAPKVAPSRWLSWLRELIIIMGLERSRRIDIALAGGAEAVQRNPSLMFTRTLPHLAQLQQLRAALAGSTAPPAMAPALPIVKEVVLIGGGHSHVHVLRMWGMRPVPGVRLTVISRDLESPYSGMLPGHVAGVYTKEECHIDLAKLSSFAKARLVHAEVQGIDIAAKRIVVEGRPPLRYDILSINIGCTPRFHGAHSGGMITPVKPIDGFSARWYALLQDAFHGDVSKPIRIAVVGGGGGGVELALAIRARLHTELARRGVRTPEALVCVTVVSRSPTLMPNHSPAVRHALATKLRELGVAVRTGKEVVGSYTADDGDQFLRCADGTTVAYDHAMWCTEGAPQAWLCESGLAVDAEGFLRVDSNLRCVGQDSVFAAGDCATMDGHPRPKAGVFAVRMGMPLADNVCRLCRGEPLVDYVPQLSFLGLVGTGDGRCVASRGVLALEGKYLWDLKDWIDRKWMHDYTTGLPDMTDDAATGDAARVAQAAGEEAMDLLRHSSMRCGGCGAKVGHTVLHRAMARLEGSFPTHPDVLVAMDAADDCAVVRSGTASEAVTVHTVDYFKAFIDDPFVLGGVAANHALSDCHAMGAQPTVALAVVTLAVATDAVREDDLVQLMAGANAKLAEAGCALGGGHTAESPEMSVGFAVTGSAPSEGSLLRKGGMQPGDVLVVTKPIGTGAIFAAHMRSKARGPWVASAVQHMLRSNGDASVVLQGSGATACTDVTGFGLVGHLAEMCRASSAAARVSLSAVPLLEGARDVVGKGILSSLAPANMRARHLVEVRPPSLVNEDAYALLYDPQTAGGLLASVPASQAEACVRALVGAGYPSAAVIGEVVAPEGGDGAPLIVVDE